MRPTNPLVILPLEVRPPMESTRNPAVKAASYFARLDLGTVNKMSHRRTTVTTMRSTIAVCAPISGSSISSSSSKPASNEPVDQDPSRHQSEGARSKQEVSFVQKSGASWQRSIDMQQTAERLYGNHRINSCGSEVGIQGNTNKLEICK